MGHQFRWKCYPFHDIHLSLSTVRVFLLLEIFPYKDGYQLMIEGSSIFSLKMKGSYLGSTFSSVMDPSILLRHRPSTLLRHRQSADFPN